MTAFVHYFDTHTSLDDRLRSTFEDLRISASRQEHIRAFLWPLQVKDRATFEHSIRVGLLSRQIACCMHLDQNAMLYAGLLHDVGKAQTPLSTLQKTVGWTSDDQELIMQHVMDGYRLLRDQFDFTAEIILWHHQFQRSGYPKIIPPVLHDYSAGTKVMIPFYGRILALADCFDALHRVNDKVGDASNITGAWVKQRMFEYNPDQQKLLEELYAEKVFAE